MTRVAIDTLRVVASDHIRGVGTSASVVAGKMEIPVRTAQYRLLALTRRKLVKVAGEWPTGRRPTYLYALTPHGKKVLDNARPPAQVLRLPGGPDQKDRKGKTDGTDTPAKNRRLRAAGD